MAENETGNEELMENPSNDENLQKDKAPKEKPQKPTKEEKKAQKQKEKEKAKAQKEWEEGISKNKRVKAEERRKKVRRAMLVLLVFSMITTSVVYSTLLFVEENNVRITATSNDAEKGLALSMDNSLWTPYLNGKGPESMADISYNKLIDGGNHPWDMNEVVDILNSDDPLVGNRDEDSYIAFMFLLKNTSPSEALVQCEMGVDVVEEFGLENACRVMWGTAYSRHPESSVRVFSTLSNNEKLKDLKINKERTAEDGYLEYCSYPYTRGGEYIAFDENGEQIEFENFDEYEAYLDEDENRWAEAEGNGYFACEPFLSDEYVFQDIVELDKGEIMYCYIQIWLEGSDYDCVDAATRGKVKMNLNFTVVG